MPIPRPKENETEKEFIKRCMSSDVMKSEFPEIKQRLAVCYSQWRKNMTEPSISDVHIPQPEKKISVKVKPRYILEAVPIFKVGEWKGEKYTIEDLDEIVKNTNALIKENLHEPPIKIGHDENQEYLLNKSGLPSFGFVKKLYRVGDEIFADIEVPKEVLEWVERRFYDKVSAEIYLNFEHPITKENIGKVLRAVAFLGADLPAVKGLGSIAFHNETKNTKKQAIVFEDKNLKEVKSMSIWTIDEIKRILPCCYERVKKYMEEKNKKEIDGDELAQLLMLIRYEEVKKDEEVKNETNNTIECPEGYIWDENLGRCVRTDKKEEEHIICPKGYKWDEEQKRCVEVVVEEKKQQEEKIEEIEGEIDEEKLFLMLLEILEKSDIKEHQLPGGEPRGWTKESFQKAFESLGGTFESCVDRVSDKLDDPESFCAWLKYRATGKWPGTEAWRKRPHLSEEEQQKIKELEQKISELENKQFNEEIEKLKKEYRNILLPRFDEYIKKFSEISNVVKFDDKNINFKKLFVDFLKDIIQSKVVIFGEITKTQKLEIDNEKRQKLIEKFNEKEEKLQNIDLAILAEEISQRENIPYRDALIKAKKILNEGGV